MQIHTRHLAHLILTAFLLAPGSAQAWIASLGALLENMQLANQAYQLRIQSAREQLQGTIEDTELSLLTCERALMLTNVYAATDRVPKYIPAFALLDPDQKVREQALSALSSRPKVQKWEMVALLHLLGIQPDSNRLLRNLNFRQELEMSDVSWALLKSLLQGGRHETTAALGFLNTFPSLLQELPNEVEQTLWKISIRSANEIQTALTKARKDLAETTNRLNRLQRDMRDDDSSSNYRSRMNFHRLAPRETKLVKRISDLEEELALSEAHELTLRLLESQSKK